MRRGRFHQYVVESWLRPRKSGEVFTYNFGSKTILIDITYLGSCYLVEASEYLPTDNDDDRYVQYFQDGGLFDTGTIADMCAEAESYMREVLEVEGTDPDSFC